ncbi:MAG: tyrosine/phenylalanine carboxypeptidase domain-containing protein, partial [Planctomycetaceae bacterium]
MNASEPIATAVPTDSLTTEFEELTQAVCERLALNKPIRRTLPGGGRVRIDRQLPFLCVHRAAAEDADAGTRELVTTEASYLWAAAGPSQSPHLSRMCRRIGETLVEHFDSVLFLEVWAAERPRDTLDDWRPARPEFRIIAREPDALPNTIQALRESLAEIRVLNRTAEVTVAVRETVAPPGLPPLRSSSSTENRGRYLLGLEIEPVYRDPATRGVYPVVLSRLRRQLAVALRRTFFAFAGFRTRRPPAHYETLGPRALAKAAGTVDEQLGRVAESFDFLLQVTPLNADEAWQRFQDRKFQWEPVFHYRPLPDRPEILKRRLFDVPLEHIEDPTLEHLLGEKQDELDRQISALRDLQTPHFLYDSLQLYGEPDEDLRNLADAVLAEVPPAVDGDTEALLAAEQVAEHAGREIARYRG